MIHFRLTLFEPFDSPTLKMRVGETYTAKKEIISHCFKTNCTWLAFLANPRNLGFLREYLWQKSIRCFSTRLNYALFMTKHFTKETTFERHCSDNIITIFASLIMSVLLSHVKMRKIRLKNLRYVRFRQTQKLPIKEVNYDVKRLLFKDEIHKTHLFFSYARESIINSDCLSWNPSQFCFLIS